MNFNYLDPQAFLGTQSLELVRRSLNAKTQFASLIFLKIKLNSMQYLMGMAQQEEMYWNVD